MFISEGDISFISWDWPGMEPILHVEVEPRHCHWPRAPDPKDRQIIQH